MVNTFWDTVYKSARSGEASHNKWPANELVETDPELRCFISVARRSTWIDYTGQAQCRRKLHARHVERIYRTHSLLWVARQPSCQRAELRRRRTRVQIAVSTLSGNGLRQTVHTHCASVHQAVKLVAAVLKVAAGNCRPGGM